MWWHGKPARGAGTGATLLGAGVPQGGLERLAPNELKSSQNPASLSPTPELPIGCSAIGARPRREASRPVDPSDKQMHASAASGWAARPGQAWAAASHRERRGQRKLVRPISAETCNRSPPAFSPSGPRRRASLAPASVCACIALRFGLSETACGLARPHTQLRSGFWRA